MPYPEDDDALWFETPARVLHEFEEAVEERTRKMADRKRQVGEYHGPFFRQANGERPRGSRTPKPKNHAYAWMTRVIPEMAWDNPRVEHDMVGPNVSVWDMDLRTVALNQLIEDEQLDEFLAQGPYVDMQWLTCGVLVMPTPIRDMRPIAIPPKGGWKDAPEKRQPSRPSFYYIPPERYIEDPAATTRAEIRFIGYEWRRPRAALIAEAEADPDSGWNLEMLRAMPQYDRKTDDNMVWGPREVDAHRDDVHGVTLWIAEADPLEEGNTSDKGFHGRLVTLPGTAQRNTKDDGDWLREPRDYHGPPTGPIQPFGIYTTPGYASFFGPLTATQEQADALSETAAANSRSARAYKVMVFVNDKSGKLVQKVRSGKHHYVYSVEGFSAQDVAQIAQGGVTDQNLVQEQREQEHLDEISGLSELRKGTVTGKATATENAIANDNAGVRFEYVEKRAYKCGQGLLRKAAWFLDNNEDVLFPLSGESAAKLGYKPRMAYDENGQPVLGPNDQPMMMSRSLWFRGGKQEHERSMAVRADLRIVPKSMSRRGTQKEALATTQFIGWLASVIPGFRQFPEARWADLVDDYAQALGLPKMAKRVDWELVEEFAKQAYGMQVATMRSQIERASGYEGQVGGGGPSFGGGDWWRNASAPGGVPGGRGAQGLQLPPPVTQGAGPGSQGGSGGAPGGARGGGRPAPSGASNGSQGAF